jgi:hypothetical protein
MGKIKEEPEPSLFSSFVSKSTQKKVEKFFSSAWRYASSGTLTIGNWAFVAFVSFVGVAIPLFFGSQTEMLLGGGEGQEEVNTETSEDEENSSDGDE